MQRHSIHLWMVPDSLGLLLPVPSTGDNGLSGRHDILCRVDIGMGLEAATQAPELLLVPVDCLSVATTAALLAGVCRRDMDKPAPEPFEFVFDLPTNSPQPWSRIERLSQAVCLTLLPAAEAFMFLICRSSSTTPWFLAMLVLRL